MKKKICVLIPTLNEEDNILGIIEKIKKTKIKLDVLFIDDNSTDDTQKIIRIIKKNNKNIYAIFRNKKGVGSAHKEGLVWCYKNKYSKVISMDCDGTHDPKYFKKMLSLSENYDLVSTSRFIKKGSISDWPTTRKFITILRHILLKFFLNLHYDASGAFRCININKISIKNFTQIKSNGYTFFWESLFYLNKKKFRIVEIPVKLYYRKIGSSKMKMKDIFYSAFYLIRLSLKRFYSIKNY